MKRILVLSLAILALSGVVSSRFMEFDPLALDECTPDNCVAPNCRCSSTDIPGGLRSGDIPQIVTLTLNGGNTVTTTELYARIFNGIRKNPNGQNISATFYVNHEYNDYTLSHELWREGHEIALNTLTKTSSQQYWENLDEEGWIKEFGGQIDQFVTFAKIPAADIQGVRSPYLIPPTDAMYNATVKAGLRYDSSTPTVTNNSFFFPYTADFKSSQGCVKCMNESHPDLWISPLISLTGENGALCSTADGCLNAPRNEDETVGLLTSNFLRHYVGNRAPFGIHASVGWLTNVEAPWIKEGYIKFIDFVLSLGDVYIVSTSKALDWVQNPQPLSGVDNLPSWRPSAIKTNGCTFAFSCAYDASQMPPQLPGQSRIMKICSICPNKYPWLDNPLGQ